MALKSMGQSDLAATTDTAIYTVTAGKQAVFSTVSFCNRNATPVKVRLAHRVAGAALANSQYIVYDATIAGNDSLYLTLGIAAASTDIINARSDTANVTVQMWGDES